MNENIHLTSGIKSNKSIENVNFKIDLDYIRSLLVLFWNLSDRENIIERDIIINQVRDVLDLDLSNEKEIKRREGFVKYLKCIKENLFDNIEYETFEAVLIEKTPQSHRFNLFFKNVEEALEKYRSGDKFIEFQNDYSYQSLEELFSVNTLLANFTEDGLNINFETSLKKTRNSLRRTTTNFTQLFISIRQSEIDILRQALCQIFNDPLFLNIDLPNDYKLNNGIFELIKSSLKVNEDKFENKQFAVIFVNNYTKRAKDSIFDGFQSYAHLYGQNTGEDMTSAMHDQKNKKTFEHYTIKTLVITLIDDSEGKEIQDRIFRETHTNDFVDVIRIP